MELGFIELLSECFTLADQAGVGSEQLVQLIKDQHSSPQLIRYADRITKNRFDSEGGFNLGGGITDARWVARVILQMIAYGMDPLLTFDPSSCDSTRLISTITTIDSAPSLAWQSCFTPPSFLLSAPAGRP
jgi:hypothetical protein